MRHHIVSHSSSHGSCCHCCHMVPFPFGALPYYSHCCHMVPFPLGALPYRCHMVPFPLGALPYRCHVVPFPFGALPHCYHSITTHLLRVRPRQCIVSILLFRHTLLRLLYLLMSFFAFSHAKSPLPVFFLSPFPVQIFKVWILLSSRNARHDTARPRLCAHRDRGASLSWGYLAYSCTLHLWPHSTRSWVGKRRTS